MAIPLTISGALRAIVLVAIACTTWEICARIQDQVTLGIPATALRYSPPILYAYGKDGPHGIPYARDGKFRINSAGFRGPELVNGRVTVLALGSSETFGISESMDNEYPRQLERRLNAGENPARFQVVNAALPGERLGDLLTALPSTLAATHPAYAILYPSTANVVWTDAEWNAKHPTPATKDPPLVRFGRSRIVDRLLKLVNNALPDPIQALQRKREVTASVANAQVVPTDHLPEAHFVAFRRLLDRSLDVLALAHVRPILITHATRFGPWGTYRDAQLQTFRTFYPELTDNGLFDAERRLNAQIRAAAAAHHLPVVEAASRIAPGPDNFSDFFHFTDRGSAGMARLIAPAILADPGPSGQLAGR